MLMREILLEMFFKGQRPCSHRISRIKHLDQNVRRVNDLMQLVPDTGALACGHSLVSVFNAILIINVLEVVRILIEIVLLLLDIFDKFLHVSNVQLNSLSSAVGAKGAFVCLDLQKPKFILFDGLSKQRSWDFFGLDKYLCGIFFFSRHLYPQLLERFLIDGPNITEPFPIGVDSGCFGWSLMHLLFVRCLLVVHFQSLDGILGSVCIADSACISLDDSVGVVGRVGL